MPKDETLLLCEQIIQDCERLNATHRDDTIAECERIVARCEARRRRIQRTEDLAAIRRAAVATERVLWVRDIDSAISVALGGV